MKFRNIIICNNINKLKNNFKNNYLIKNFKSNLNFYLHNKYIIGESILSNNCFFIRIWKSRAFYNKLFTKFDINDNMYCCFDYMICDDYIKILYIYIKNNDNYDSIMECIINYIDNIAIINNIKNIVYDFNKYKLNYNNYSNFVYNDSNIF
jgi:hypothetical protein